MSETMKRGLLLTMGGVLTMGWGGGFCSEYHGIDVPSARLEAEVDIGLIFSFLNKECHCFVGFSGFPSAHLEAEVDIC